MTITVALVLSVPAWGHVPGLGFGPSHLLSCPWGLKESLERSPELGSPLGAGRPW